jgi:hypothetical protein
MFSLQLKTLTLLHTLTTKSKYIIITEYKHPVHSCCSMLMMMYVTFHRRQTFLSVRFITKNILNQRILLHLAGTDCATVINTYDRVVTNELAGHAFGIPTLDISSNRSATECVYMHVTFKTTEHFDCLSA